MATTIENKAIEAQAIEAQEAQAQAQKTVEEIYLTSEEVTDVHATLCQMLSKLYNAEAFLNVGGHNQVVIQLNKERKGKQWKMFIYYNTDRECYVYSYQDEEYDDTMFEDCEGMLNMIELIEKEIAYVNGFEWIAMDQD